MKKVLSITTLAILLLLISGCKASKKDLRNILKKINETTFDQQALSISFTQEYILESHSEDDIEKMDYSIEYIGSGTLSIIMDETDMDITGYETLLDYNMGYINCLQNEKYNYIYSDLDKISNEEKKEVVTSESINDFKLKYDKDKCYVSSSIEHIDKNDNTKNVKNKFAGKIDRNLLNDTNNSDNLDRLQAKIVTMDGNYLNGLVESYAESMFIDSAKLSDKELNKIIKNNKISAKKNKNTTVINFSINTSDVINYFYGTTISSKNNVKGTIELDNKTNKLVSFKYDLNKLLYDLFKTDDPMKITVKNYIVNGMVIDSNVIDMPIEGDFIEYNDSALFISDIETKAIPNYEN